MVPVAYSVRNLRVRWKTTLTTASSFTLVVSALVLMLAFVRGVQRVCAISGEANNVVVLRQGSSDESFMKMDSNTVQQVESFAATAKDPDGLPLASRELFMFVSDFADRSGSAGTFQVRGVLPAAFKVHSEVKLVEGREMKRGIGEIVIGRGVHRQYKLSVGDELPIGRKTWRIAGIFDSGGSTFDSEIWCDISELASQFRREGVYSSVVIRTFGPREAVLLAEQLTANRSIGVDAQTEPAYYIRQAEQTQMIRNGVWVITVFMAVGAVFGVMNSMYAAVAQRTRDIAVLRVLGFARGEILVAFLIESLLIAAIGGSAGAAIAYAANGITHTAEIGWKTVEFAFTVDASVLIMASICTGLMGTLGGLFPAVTAMRVEPLEALR